jgi:hypothetical protein
MFFLLLGALTTIFVAWALCALGSATDFPAGTGESGGMRSSRDEVLEWPVNVPGDWPRPTFLYARIGRGLRLDIGNVAAGVEQGPDGAMRQTAHYQITSVRSGWPLLAMQSRTVIVRHHGGTDRTERSPAIALPFWLRQYLDGISAGYLVTRSLPLMPVWPAFLASALLYALGFWIVLRLPRRVRAFVRSRRGQCVLCGYPRGSSHVCTECGAPFVAHRN